MPNEYVKSSATPYAGYRYQTLRGVHILVDWLYSPTLYTQVKFECDDRSVGPQGLDDLIALRPDGKFDYWQVKYTPPEAAGEYFLDWEWLTGTSTKSSRSLVQKWAEALRKIPPSQLGEACLITNRAPDRAVATCLRGETLDYDLAKPEVQRTLDAQLGGPDEARKFFAALKIRHSERSYNSLESDIRARLAGAYDQNGIERLLGRAPNWANFKNDPPPDGWITLDVLRGLLSPARPSPMPEDFEVPAGYEVPDQAFHEGLLQTLKSSSGGVYTLVGPPGRGKSTYLSHLCECLASDSIPFVRHHYFLSLHDRTADRLSPYLVALSLLGQIEREHSDANAPTDKSEQLSQALAACGDHYAMTRVPFVVVVDGLDHVWRDNYGDKRPLDDVFKQLLPLPPNVVLLVGTQPVEDAKLPQRLLTECPRANWLELPRMTGHAVYGYLHRQVMSGRWQLSPSAISDELADQAKALFELTLGHPLHLIYSVEALLHATSQPTTYHIEQLPTCPGEDIRAYYGELWSALSYEQKDVLHLMCGLPFRWPEHAFTEMSQPGARGLSTKGVEHLLYETETGLSPFHQSLIVFVSEQSDHVSQVKLLLPQAAQWLMTSAAPVLRNSWLWSVQANMGDATSLRTGVTRDWILDRLTEGYPAQTFVRMLTEAEVSAFSLLNYAETYQHRSLKTRLLNGPEFQLDDAPRLMQQAWALSQDDSVVQDARVSRHELSTSQLTNLGIALYRRGKDQQAYDVVNYARQRWNTELKFQSGRHQRETYTEAARLARALALSRAFDCDNEVSNVLFDKRPPVMAKELCLGLVETGDLTALMSIREVTHSPPRAEVLETSATRLAAASGANLVAWSEFRGFVHSSMAAIFGWIWGAPMASLPSRPLHIGFASSVDWVAQQRRFSKLVTDWFMKSLAVELYAEGDFSWLPAPEFSDRENLAEYLTHLESFAARVADSLRSHAPVPFEAIFEHFSEIKAPTRCSYQNAQVYRDFRKALVEVAIDLHFLSSTFGGDKTVSLAALNTARQSHWFSQPNLPEKLLDVRLLVLSSEAARDVLSVECVRLLTELQETSVIADGLVTLCEMARMHGELDEARRLCRLAWDITIGYGHRKDSALDSALTAIEYLADADPTSARRLLSTLAPQIANVTEYTDGSGTRHIPGYAAKLLAKLDRPAMVELYSEHVALGDWSDAQICMKHFLRSASEATPELTALTRTGLSEDEYRESKDASPLEKSIAASAASFVGAASDTVAVTSDSTSSLTPSQSFLGKPEEYPPLRFQQLLTDLRDSGVFGRDFLVRWFDYWKAKGRGSALLRALRPIALRDGEYRSDCHYVLDRLLALSLELNGANDSTFEIAVKAQIANFGWGAYFESVEDSEARLNMVARHFASRADEFIAKSTKNQLMTRDNPSSIVVPGEKLVFFLVKIGRTVEAVALAQAMVDCIVAETSSLVLRQPTWTS